MARYTERSDVKATSFARCVGGGILLLTAGLQWSLSWSPNVWDKDRTRRVAGRFAATVSILVWCGILFAGRWIAYTQAG